MRTAISWLTRWRKSPRFFLALGAVLILSVVAYAQITGIVYFELDGNATANGSADDWQTLVTTGGSAAHGFKTFTGVTPDPGVLSSSGTTVTDQTTFTGSNKDSQDTTTWSGGSGSIPPKDDITNAYSAFYSGTNGHQIVVFGADRFANNGDADMGFWFFVKSTSYNSTTGAFSPAHTGGNTSGAKGDILVLTNFSQASNFTGTVEVLEWFPQCNVSNSNKAGNNFVDARCLSNQPLLVLQSAGVATCGPGAPDDVCAISNTNPAQLYWSYRPKTAATGGDCTGSTNCAPAGSFFEGAIDITALVGNECISSYMPETRSSTSVTATLEDFVAPIPLNTCGISVQKSCPSNTIIHTGGGDTFQYTFGGVVQNTGFGIDHNVIVVDSFPTGYSNLSAPNQTTCPTGSPAGAICFSLGDMAGGTCKLWPNNTSITCSTLTGGADPNASTDFASNTFQDATNSASNSASVTSTEISAKAVQATCPTQAGLPAINTAKTCSVTISSGLKVTVGYSGDVCNESNLTLNVSNEPTDVQLIPTGTTSTGTASYCNPGTGGTCPAVSLPFNLQACQALVTSSAANPTPCTPAQTCSDNGQACSANTDCINPNFPTCSSTGGSATKVCMSCGATAAGVCQHYTGSYNPTQSSAGPDSTGSAGTVCFKDQVTASASSTLLNQSTTNTNNPAASCPLCPGGSCPTM